MPLSAAGASGAQPTMNDAKRTASTAKIMVFFAITITSINLFWRELLAKVKVAFFEVVETFACGLGLDW